MKTTLIALVVSLILLCIGIGANAQNSYVAAANVTDNSAALWLLNDTPSFVNGAVITLSACAGNTTSLNTLLAVVDSDMAQTETWTVNFPPVHGILSGFSASAASTGGTVTSAGLSYTPAIGYSGPDSFSIKISDGIAESFAVVQITVNPTPPIPASIAGPTTVCTGSVITLTNATAGGTWGVSNSTASISAAGVVTGISAGTDTVIYSVSLASCASTATAAITISPTVVPLITITSPQADTVCSGRSITYTAAAANAGPSPAWQWKLNGASVSAANTYSFTPANHDVVSCTTTSSVQCASPAFATVSHTVTVTTRITPLVSIISDGGDSVCLGTNLLYYASCTGCGSSPVYYWSVNNVYYTSGNPFRNTPADGDMVQATTLSNLLCRAADSAASAPMHMAVFPFITPSVSITGAGGRQVKPGQSDTLVAIVVNGGPTEPYYQWEVNGLVIPGATNRVFIQTFSNYDTVTCIASGSNACSASAVARTIISDGSAGSNLVLFPNPNSGTFTVRGNVNVSDKEVLVNIFDAIGRLMYSTKLHPVSGAVDEQVVLGRGVPAGVYIACLYATGLRKTIKFSLIR